MRDHKQRGGAVKIKDTQLSSSPRLPSVSRAPGCTEPSQRQGELQRENVECNRELGKMQTLGSDKIQLGQDHVPGPSLRINDTKQEAGKPAALRFNAFASLTAFTRQAQHFLLKWYFVC